MNEILDKIHSFHEGLSPSKVARKYEFLTENAFRFFRGTNNLFYEDLNKAHLGSSPSTWVCGDLHLENFGSYKGDNRLVYFDINDFDESILAPVNWEIVRMVTSILVGFDALHITDKEAIKVAETFLQQYAQILSEGHHRGENLNRNCKEVLALADIKSANKKGLYLFVCANLYLA